jgi:FkbH-like protein
MRRSGLLDFSVIKLVIWDLDDTFWEGTLSEGGIRAIAPNVELVRRLTDCGVINSICSKNDGPAVDAELRRLQIRDLFVMCSVTWQPKGQRIRELIDDMRLQAQHVMFIDDNPMNREEAAYYCPGLMTAAPETIPELIRHAASLPAVDPEHQRLSRYRILETKLREKASAVSNETFLRESDIHLRFGPDCLEELDRIAELTSRTNQLNVTKNRMTRAELATLFTDPATTGAYLSVRDRFGEYGIVGFYAIRDGALVHFVFSCSTMGMGIEQFTYDHVGRPPLTIVGDVASTLDQHEPIDYITIDTINHDVGGPTRVRGRTEGVNRHRRVLFKGPCDVRALIPMIDARRATFDSELNQPDDRGVMITAHNHSAHIAQALTRSVREIDELVSKAPFLNADAFTTSMFDGYDVVVLSMLTDSHEGFYRLRRDPSLGVAFSSFRFDLTDTVQWADFIDGTRTNHGFPFTSELLAAFADDFEFMGPLPASSVVENLTRIRAALDGSTLLLLLLTRKLGDHNG